MGRVADMAAGAIFCESTADPGTTFEEVFI
jgi:hypothetical protein